MQTTTKQTLNYYYKHAKKYKLLFAGILFFLALAVLIDAIFCLYLFKNLIDKISNFTGNKQEIFPEILQILFYIAGLYLFAEIIAYRMAGFLNAFFQTKIMKNINDECFKLLQHHSFDFFANNFAGSLVTKIKRMVNSFERIADIITWNIFPLVIQVGFSMILLYFYAPIFALILGLFVIIYVFVSYKFSEWKMKYYLKYSALDSRITGEMSDAITNVIAIKIFVRLKNECQKFFKTTYKRAKAIQKLWNLQEITFMFNGLIMTLVEFGMLYFAIKLWSEDKISVGVVILVQGLMMSIFKNLWNLGNILKDFYQALSNSAEMTEILNTPVEIIDIKKPEKCKIKKGEIEFRNLNFGYNKKTNIFKNFNFKIKAGQKIGLVGESGTGKTTLTKLLLRFAEPQKGDILIDGQSIFKISQDDLRKNISFVPQEPVLFHRSLWENIRYGNMKATDQEIFEATEKAHAKEFIKKTPAKYETLVGERGIKLSGGERQRISIARAILKNAPILILDEATSALDSRAENLIQQAFGEVMKNRTTIAIAHRLSTLREMDLICVIGDSGEILEFDTHENLLAKNGKYAELWKHQVGGFL